MTVLGEEVDSVPLERHRLKQDGYLAAMLECLCVKHQRRLEQTRESPLFYLEAGSKMNDAGFAGETDTEM